MNQFPPKQNDESPTAETGSTLLFTSLLKALRDSRDIIENIF